MSMLRRRRKAPQAQLALAEFADRLGNIPTEHFPERVQHRAGSLSVPEQIAELIVEGRALAGRTADSWEVQRYARMLSGEWYRVPAVISLPAGRIFVSNRTGVHVTASSEVLRDSTPTYSPAFDPGPPPPPGAVRKLPGRVVSLLSLWDRNYAHWLMDSLPRACAIADPSLTFAIRAGSPGFAFESLEVLGVGRERIVEIEEEWFTADEMLCLRAAPSSGVPHGELLRLLRRRLVDGAGGSTAAAGRRLWIRRGETQSSSKRRLLNEAEVATVLAGHGFGEVFPEQLAFREQVRLFAGASWLCGAHGAGIYNLLFAANGIGVIEFYNHAYWDHAAARLCSLLGQQHYHIFSRNEDPERNFHVPCGQLRKLLSGLLPDANRTDACEAEF
jgi:hypothetical protein